MKMNRWKKVTALAGLFLLCLLFSVSSIAANETAASDFDFYAQLTQEEQEFIASCPSLRVAATGKRYPISYFDEQTDEFCGISADVMRLISEMTGLSFTYLPAQDDPSIIGRLEAGSIDLTVSFPPKLAQESELSLTEPYLSTPLVLISGNKNHASNRIALPPAFYDLKDLAGEDNGWETVYYASIEECFEALRKGDASSTYANSYTASHLLSDPKYVGFSAITLLGQSDELCIAGAPSLDPMVLHILNKAVGSISAAQLNDIILANTSRPVPVSLHRLFYQNPRESMLLISGFFLLALIVLIFFLLHNSRYNRRIKRLLYEDPLTGMWNFNKFRIQAAELLKSNSQQQRALIYLDIDKFKYINDSFGYAKGDEILRSIARMLLQFVDNGEMFARVSADHFVLLLEMQSHWEFDKRMQQLKIRLDEVSHDQENHLWFIVLGGICVMNPNETDLTSAVDWANFAKETITDAHQTTLVYYSDTIRDNLKVQKALEQRMESALSGHEFTPYLQPKVDIFTRQVVGAEALVRWIGQDGIIVSPAQFIPLFERNGFVVQMDLYIFDRVCTLMREWLDTGKPVIPIACNFSRLHLRNPAFPELLQQIAANHDIEPSMLELEITESVAMENAAVLEQQIRQLADIGFRLAIDDFGTGYSSLGLLQRLPVDVLKLDKIFIDKGFLEKREREVVSGMVQIASNLNMQVVCEGVETEEQLEILRQIGCRVAQGYFYARPMPCADFEIYLAQNRQECPVE